MRRRLLAFVASAVLLPAATAGSATADGPSVQAIGQQAASQQSATSSATSTQVAPSNTNVSVRIGSPGDGGAVTQTNSSSAASAAGNANTAIQQAAQAAAAAGVQSVDQAAASQQSAQSAATSTQDHPKNTNISVRIMSPGNDGDVTQANSSSATSAAGNANATQQSAGQSGAGSGGVQHVGQKASNDQDASSEATSEQEHPKNVNVPVRIFSPGNDGSVTQTNSSSAKSAAGNDNTTSQASAQDSGGGPSVQDAEQHASNDQSADSSAASKQVGASNVNAPVRIYSPGHDGSVIQTNSSSAVSAAGNANRTSQHAAQDAGPSEPVVVAPGESGPVVVQAVGQWADNAQAADSSADSTQKGASNENAPVRVKSDGGDGAVYQANSSSAKSSAGNANATDQITEQSAEPWSDILVQAIGQRADSEQGAWSHAASEQLAPSNANEPVAIGSPAYGGEVEQSNDSSAASAAGNHDATCQAATQGPATGPRCGRKEMTERARRVH
jgi:hypothetical protein